MAFTAEQKKAHRKKKKAEEELQKQAQKRKIMETRIPDNKLKKPLDKHKVGVPKDDCGAHQKALNCHAIPFDNSVNEVQLTFNGEGEDMSGKSVLKHKLKKGDFSVGLVHEGDWKAKSCIAGKGQRKMSLKSEEHCSFLLTVKEALHPLVDSTLGPLMEDTMRVSVLRGASTLAHTDSCKGNADNWLCIPQEPGVEPGHLSHDVFPIFKHSVVTIDGKFCVPHSCSFASGECKCIGENPDLPGKPIYFSFQHDITDQMQPCGNLGCGVVGWKVNGSIQIVDDCEEACLCNTTPLIFEEVTWKELLADAGKNRVFEKPRKRIRSMAKTDTWMSFHASKCRHWWCGNPMTLRIHVFFRTIQQCTPTSIVCKKGSNKINYIDATDKNNWKIFKKTRKGSPRKWHPVNNCN